MGHVEEQLLVDRQTIRRLSRMPIRARSMYCRRLSDSVAATKFAEDMNRSLDILSVASQNPNLPEKRRYEIQDKRRQLKDSVEETLELQRERNAPINEVVSQINQQGSDFENLTTGERFSNEATELRLETAKQQLLDCADGVMCSKRRSR